MKVDEFGPTLGQLEKRATDWLVQDLVPLGSVTGLTGPIDAGKSILCCSLATDAAGGPRLDGGKRRLLGPCLWYTSEEDPCSMIRPRLLAAGCPLDGCKFPQHDSKGVLQHPLKLPSQFPHIMRAVQATGAKLIVLDPPTAVFDHGLNPNMPSDVETVMKGLIHLAQSQAIAIMVVLQMNKRQGGSTTEKVAGAGKWMQMSRVVLRLGFHPSKKDHRLLTFGRYGLGKRPKSRSFQIEDFQGDPRFVLGDQANMTDDDAGTQDLDSYQWEEMLDAAEWLRRILADGRQPAQMIWEKWSKAGYGRNQWWKVRRELGILVEREGSGTSHQVFLSLPSPSHSVPPTLHTGVVQSNGDGVPH
jgi:hypothetical protein